LPARRDASSLTTTTDPALASYTTDCVIRLPRPSASKIGNPASTTPTSDCVVPGSNPIQSHQHLHA
jgi:hypothetical protein